MTAPDGPVRYDRDPAHYRHWRLAVDGAVATLHLGVDEGGGIRPGYALKLNSYDLGVDIELHDALQRIRFEHPGVKVVVVTSALARMFCAGANIYMLAVAPHGWKVNFCKFTNETRNGIEDSSAHSGIRFIAALNGTAAGGGYELALACDEIILVDDRASAVSLPEVPLLGVLPGTGGLTRLVDKRKVRRDRADVFCTSEEGARGRRALAWGLVDALAPRQRFDRLVAERAEALAATSPRPAAVTAGVALPPLPRRVEADGYRYRWVDAAIDRTARTASLTVRAPGEPGPATSAAARAAGADWWPLAMARELDDAILMLRTNQPEIGLWLLRTEGDPATVLAVDAVLQAGAGDWFLREVTGMLRRTLARLDVSSRSLFALVEPGSCFAGTLLELALAADRSYMLSLPDDPGAAPRIALGPVNFGAYPMASAATRLAARFGGETAAAQLTGLQGRMLDPQQAEQAGLVTFTPDDIDWDEEIRIAVEERASLSPDALTGLEANLRFAGAESLASKIFGRLSAWQNWIFHRPNAAGERGTLRRFGSGARAEFDRERV